MTVWCCSGPRRCHEQELKALTRNFTQLRVAQRRFQLSKEAVEGLTPESHGTASAIRNAGVAVHGVCHAEPGDPSAGSCVCR